MYNRLVFYNLLLRVCLHVSSYITSPLKHYICIDVFFALFFPVLVRFLSTNDALCALIWRCAIRARELNSSLESKVGMATNGRSRLEPKLPEVYFGNVNFYAMAMVCALTYIEYVNGE